MMNRRGYLGGSDSGAVLGLNPHRSPFEVWEEKIGRSTVVIPETVEMSLGTYLEEFVAKRYSLMTGHQVKIPTETYVHPMLPWMHGNIDRVVEEADGKPKRLLECKTGARDEGWGEGTDEIPLHYLAQCLHYLAVTGAEAIDVAVLIYNEFKKEVKLYTIPRNEAAIARLIDGETAFWNVNVQRQVPPEPITVPEAKRAYPLITGKVVTANEQIMAKVGQLQAVRATINELEKSKEALERDVAVYMREGTILQDEFGEDIALVNEIHRKGYVVDPVTYRTLRIAKQIGVPTP